MQGIIFKNIKQLAGILPAQTRVLIGDELNKITTIENAWLTVENGLIADFGLMSTLDDDAVKDYQIIDATGRLLLPAFIDSHTHLVFAGTREDEFEMRLNGATYEEIAANGGGIINSAKKLQNTSEDELYEAALKRLNDVISLGTGAIEIKSGYGLTVESELKMLRVIKRLRQNSNATIKATFLGAHAVPPEYKNRTSEYFEHILSNSLPQIAAEDLADYVDIFCESGYFSADHTEKLITEGAKFGLKAKIHVNQFNSIGGIQVAAKHAIVSVDHLEIMNDEDFSSLRNSTVIATLLPLCSFFINIPYSPAKKLIKNGVIIALASDYNPGSTPCGNMQLVQSVACVNMKLTPVEAFNASTINAAAAINESEYLGSITKGKRANLLLTKPIASLGFMTYNFGHNHIENVYLNGEKQ